MRESVRFILAKNIKATRRLRGLTQERLAERTGVSTSYIALLESAKKFPSAKSLDAMADALQLRPFELFLEVVDVGHEAIPLAVSPDQTESIRMLHKDIHEAVDNFAEGVLRAVLLR
jgi:transcriptional regulator with XRE-family HTH domain